MNGQPPLGGHDFSQVYRDHPVPSLTEVNGMTSPEALAWYHRNGYHVRPVEVVTGPDGEPIRKLAGLSGYHFDDLERPSAEEITWLAGNWNPAWQLGWILSRSTGQWGLDVDDMAIQWPKFQAEHKDRIWPTAIQQTGREGGGLQLVYLRPEEGYFDEDALRQGSWSGEFPKIEVKSKGFFTVAPSVHHKTGRKYQWLDGIPSPAETSPELLAGREHSAVEERITARQDDIRIDREARRRLDAQGRQPVALMAAAEVWDQPDLCYLVDGWIPQTGVGALFGETGTWKSFVALHLLLCVVHGLGFFGRPVNQPGRCFYLLGEGQAGARRRLRSAMADLPVPEPVRAAAPGRLDYVMVPFPLPDEQAVTELITAIRARVGTEPVSLIVFDAAADFYGAGDNESSATDMQRIIAAVKRISRELGCFVLLVAHTGHGAKGDEGEPGRMRGSSRFGQAWDFEAQAVRVPSRTGCGWLFVTKAKEDELPDAPVTFHVIKTAQGSLAVRPGHPQPGEAESEPAVPERTKAEERVWREVAAYVRKIGTRDAPLSFRRISDGVKGNQTTKRQQLDGLVCCGVLGTVSTSQGHPAYYFCEGRWQRLMAGLAVDAAEFVPDKDAPRVVFEWRHHAPEGQRHVRIEDGTETFIETWRPDDGVVS